MIPPDILDQLVPAVISATVSITLMAIFHSHERHRQRVRIENLEQSLHNAETSLRIAEKSATISEKRAQEAKQRTIKAKDAVIESLHTFCKAAEITGEDIIEYYRKLETEKDKSGSHIHTKPTRDQDIYESWARQNAKGLGNAFLTGYYNAKSKG